jgi:hypothetical protein
MSELRGAKRVGRVGVDDVLVLAGVVVLGLAIWTMWGVGAVLAYAGALLVSLGVLAGWAQARRGRGARGEGR